MIKVLKLRLKIIADRHHLDETELTSENMLNEAIEAERIYKNLGPFDPVAGRFAQQQHDFLKAAEILEQLEIEKKKEEQNEEV